MLCAKGYNLTPNPSKRDPMIEEHDASDRPDEDEEDLEDVWQGPSKSSRKRDMHKLQDLGEALVALSTDQLARMPIPDDLLEAIKDAKRFKKHEATRRQMQYIGKLMRHIDPEPIRAQLDIFKGVSKIEIARQHRLERLRNEFLEDEKVIGRIAESWPHADLQHLRVLRRNALKERELGKPPRAFREMFKELRALDVPDEPPTGPENDVEQE